MAPALPYSDYADPVTEAGASEWQALRGELVALLDQVESRYGHDGAEPAMSGLARRVRQLRDQVGTGEPSLRRREALRTVKRAVDRFSERDGRGIDDTDDLSVAIAEIRSRQGVQASAGRRGGEAPEIHELGALIGGMSQRLERLEGELKSQRANAGQVREVASQVEQLTHVVELLAGAVGETGQVKRLEAQIAALGAMIEEAPKVDLGAINARLDDVSATVGKLAQLQAEQMEREITREERRAAEPKPRDVGATLAPTMQAIEESVRNVYDRIDAIERNVALSSGDFERLTSEMAAFTQAMKDNAGAPAALVGRVETLAARLEGIETANGDVAGLKADIEALRDAVMQGMEPRFSRLESRIEALSDKVAPVDTSAVEDQLKALMARMDEAGAQLDGLARLYSAGDKPDLESLATLVAERTSEAVTRKAPAPVAMFGPDSLKSIEDRLTGLIKSAGKTPDYETLAELVATRTSEAVAKSTGSGLGPDGMDALEKRMTALLNTAGKDTAERLARLEAALAARNERQDSAEAAAATPQRRAKAAAPKAPAVDRPDAEDDPFALPRTAEPSRLDSILANLAKERGDAMPANPADDAPLIDPGFKDAGPVRTALAAKQAGRTHPGLEGQTPASARAEVPRFDPATVERPPRPQSSLAPAERDPFAAASAPAPASVEPPPPRSSTSTFVAAARRAQRARQEQAPAAESNSLIGRALARVMPKKDAEPAEPRTEPAAARSVEPAVEAPAKAEKPPRREKPPKPEKARKLPDAALPAPEDEAQPGFLTRHRRPLLLAATLVAVSMLALNLVLQRMQPPATRTAATQTSAPATPAAANPAPSDDQSATEVPRVIEMVDPTAVGSINPGAPMSFSRSTPTTPMPPTLLVSATEAGADAETPPSPAVPEVTGSIPDTVAATETPERFELPPEAVGPIELRQAAADGDAKAQFEIAAIYTEGRAVEQDFAEAAKWYERSAAQGFVPAQYRLGNLYEAGTGVEQDFDLARLWYQRSAEAGNRMAMHNLAALHAGGQLGDQQFELAAEWFEQAAQRGMTDSQFNLGMLYARGLGVEQDFEQSYKWFSLAALAGDKDAAQARDDIAKSLSAEAASRVGELVKGWKAEAIDLEANFAPIGTWSDRFDPGETITSKEVIIRVQQALAKLGFDVGTPDGVAGPKTAEAVRAFERGTGMPESGKVNPRLLAVLGSQPV